MTQEIINNICLFIFDFNFAATSEIPQNGSKRSQRYPDLPTFSQNCRVEGRRKIYITFNYDWEKNQSAGLKL